MNAGKQKTNPRGALDTRFACQHPFPEKDFRVERERIVLVESEDEIKP